jgi:hypothetical protein
MWRYVKADGNSDLRRRNSETAGWKRGGNAKSEAKIGRASARPIFAFDDIWAN